MINPCSINFGSGGSTLKGWRPVSRTKSGWRGIHSSGVPASFLSISVMLPSVQRSFERMSAGMSIGPMRDDMVAQRSSDRRVGSPRRSETGRTGDDPVSRSERKLILL